MLANLVLCTRPTPCRSQKKHQVSLATRVVVFVLRSLSHSYRWHRPLSLEGILSLQAG